MIRYIYLTGLTAKLNTNKLIRDLTPCDTETAQRIQILGSICPSESYIPWHMGSKYIQDKTDIHKHFRGIIFRTVKALNIALNPWSINTKIPDTSYVRVNAHSHHTLKSNTKNRSMTSRMNAHAHEKGWVLYPQTSHTPHNHEGHQDDSANNLEMNSHRSRARWLWSISTLIQYAREKGKWIFLILRPAWAWSTSQVPGLYSEILSLKN